MNRFKLSSRALCFALIIAAAAISTHLGITPGELELSAYCQSSACSFPACNRDGERFDPDTRDCEHRGGPPTFFRSHREPTCNAGERLDRDRGLCVIEACADGGCEARRLCTRKGYHYDHADRDSRGVYGVCESEPNFLGYRSHETLRCPDGFTLNEARGVCVGNCRTATDLTLPPPITVILPDLIIRRVFIRLGTGGTEMTEVRRGTSYYACFEVANVGVAASGPFRVGGGALGVRTLPSQAHATLLPGASRVGCLLYSGTPATGSYRLGLTADSLRAVREMREDNNEATLEVNVVPK